MAWTGGALEAALVRGDGAAAPLTALQVESWRLLRDEWAADGAAAAAWRAWEARRRAAQPEAAALARDFLAGRASVEALRAAFDRRTRGAWDAFGLRGPAGAMFLNRLAKHAARTGEGAELEGALRAALDVPATAAAARRQLGAVATYVCERGPAPQPALATAFAAAWWHLQAPAAWPMFQPSTRRVLAAEEAVYVPVGAPAADYLAFRDAALALGDALGLHPWALEHLCWWHARRGAAGPHSGRPGGAPPNDAGPDAGDARDGAARAPRRPRRAAPGRPPARARVAEGTPAPYDAPAGVAPARRAPATPSHTHVQWLLAHLGRQLGCRVWVAANDHARRWRGEALGALSVDALPPLGLDPDSQRLIELVDVVWLRGASQVAAAFEVERTTSVHSGLLRMADLAALAPNLAVPLYVVAPAARLDKVRRELRRPALRALALHRRCGFFSAESLVDAAPEIARWATGPGAIDRLAERVADG
jgi:hypothetical protein